MSKGKSKSSSKSGYHFVKGASYDQIMSLATADKEIAGITKHLNKERFETGKSIMAKCTFEQWTQFLKNKDMQAVKLNPKEMEAVSAGWWSAFTKL